jgi:hypothetical protein
LGATPAFYSEDPRIGAPWLRRPLSIARSCASALVHSAYLPVSRSTYREIGKVKMVDIEGLHLPGAQNVVSMSANDCFETRSALSI